MDLLLIAGFALLVVSIIFSFIKILKKGLTFFGSIKIVFLIAFLILSIFLYLDFQSFKENFNDSEKLFLLEESGKFIAGFHGTMQENAMITPLTKKELTEHPALGDYKEYMKGRYYKVFVFKKDAFEGIRETKIGEDSFTTQEIFKIMESDNAIEAYVDTKIAKGTAPKEQKEAYIKAVKESIKSDDELKSSLFLQLIGEGTKQQGILFLLNEFRDRKVVIYPETAVFKLVRYTPQFIFDKLAFKAGQINLEDG